MKLLLILVSLTLFSCGPAYHLQRAKLHLMKAEAKGATVNHDTIYKEIITTSTKTDTVHKFNTVKELFHDTIKMETTRWKSKTVIDTVTKTIYQQVECLPDTIKVPVSIKNNIKASGSNLFQVIMYCIAALATGYIIRAIFK